METKLQTLKNAAACGDWQKAFSIAARFPRLGAHRNAILDAHSAYTNPRFMVQIGRDVNACIEAGKLALIAAYGLDAAEFLAIHCRPIAMDVSRSAAGPA